MLLYILTYTLDLLNDHRCIDHIASFITYTNMTNIIFSPGSSINEIKGTTFYCGALFMMMAELLPDRLLMKGTDE